MSASLRRPLPDASGRTPDLRPRRRSLLAGSALVGSSVVTGGGTALADGEEDAPVSGTEDQPSSAAGAGTQAAQPRTTTIALREAEHIERDGRLARHIVGHPAALVGVTWEEGGVEPTVSVRGLQVDGAWSPWHDLEVAVDLDTGVRSNGTEPVFFADVTEVEVIGEIDGEDVTEALNAHLIDFPDDPKQAPLELDEGAVSAEDAAQERSEQPPAEGEAATPSQEPQERLTEETAPAEETGEGEDPADAPAPSDGGGATGATVGGGGVGAARPALGPIVPMSLVPRDLGIPGAPRIVTRAQWGADERAARSSSTSSALQAVVLHHTAGTNNYSPSQAAQQIRGIFDYHVRTLGWADIGYNVLIDRYGTIYEGRRGGLTRNVNGAHALGFNTGSFGISVMGDYSSLAASAVARDSVMKVAAWKLLSTFRSDIHEKSSWRVSVNGTRWSRGTMVSMPRFFGHRDVNLTSCPGNGLYSTMDNLRWGIQSRMNSGWRHHLRAFVAAGGESALGTVLTSAQKEGGLTITRLTKGIVVSGPKLSARAATTTDSIRRSWRPSWGRPLADVRGQDGRYTQPFDNGLAIREGGRNSFITRTFTDVPATMQFFEEIEELAASKITTGWSDGTYRPHLPIARDAMIAFIYRAKGSPAYAPPAVSPFRDVSPRRTFYKEICWAHSQGIAEGWSDGTFRPLDPVERGAFAAFLYRVSRATSTSTSNRFSDVPSSHQFAKEITWMANMGITTGWRDKTFRPRAGTKRDAMAAFITRWLDAT